MHDCSLLSDAFDAYAQLTPWVQALIGASICATVISIAYFLKEIVIVLMQPFVKTGQPPSAAPDASKNVAETSYKQE